MIQQESLIRVADNSGAKTVKCIRVLGGSGRRYAKVGDVFIASVRSAAPGGTVKKGEVVKAMLVRSRRDINRTDGTTVRFDDNAAVLVDDNYNPLGTRIFGPIAREVREVASSRIVSLASEVL